MVSCAGAWSEGVLLWRAEHDCQQGLYHLYVEGEPPPEFVTLRAQAIAAQATAGGEEADVDCLFDVPVELARVATGFCHDEAPNGEEETFETLA